MQSMAQNNNNFTPLCQHYFTNNKSTPIFEPLAMKKSIANQSKFIILIKMLKKAVFLWK